MVPLVKENEKFKVAINLMEGNIQRAQHERDLAESNAWDLEYQKGVLSEQLAATSEQLHGKSEQLASASTQLEQRSEQLRSMLKQKASTEYRRICFVLLNSYIFGDDCCVCRARCVAWLAAPGPRATPRGEGEGDRAGRQTGRGAER